MQQQFQGHVKFYKQKEGWGFITPSTGGADAFVHIYDLAQCGVIDLLVEGQTVMFDLADAGPRKPGLKKAVNIKVPAQKTA